MKKNVFIISMAAALCALTSCGRELTSFPDMAASPADNTNAVAISAGSSDSNKSESTEPKTEVTAPTEQKAAAEVQNGGENIPQSENVTAANIVVTDISEPAAKKEFTNGVCDGNVYISEYAGIKLTLPEEASFLNVDDLYTHYTMPTRFMSEAEVSFYKTGILDACASYYGAMSGVDVWFYDTKLRYPDAPDMSAEEFMKRDELDFSPEIEVSDISDVETVNICGENYAKASYTSFSCPRITYARRIDDDRIMVIRTSGISADDFEGRFESLR